MRVEVYGVIGGNPGWTEEYGWLHKGSWQIDFLRLVTDRELELEGQERVLKEQKYAKVQKRLKEESLLLSNYYNPNHKL